MFIWRRKSSDKRPQMKMLNIVIRILMQLCSIEKAKPLLIVTLLQMYFSIGILDQVWCLIVSISDLCPLSYFSEERYQS